MFPELKKCKVYLVKLPSGTIVDCTAEVANELIKTHGNEVLIGTAPGVKISWKGESWVLRLPYHEIDQVKDL